MPRCARQVPFTVNHNPAHYSKVSLLLSAMGTTAASALLYKGSAQKDSERFAGYISTPPRKCPLTLWCDQFNWTPICTAPDGALAVPMGHHPRRQPAFSPRTSHRAWRITPLASETSWPRGVQSVLNLSPLIQGSRSKLKPSREHE